MNHCLILKNCHKRTELALKQQQLQHRLKSLSRSSSQDQSNYHYNRHHQQQQYLVDGSPQKTSEQRQQANAVSAKRPTTSYSSNWQLLRQHTTTQSLDNSDILNSTPGNAEIPSSLMARRCSVPAVLSYQRRTSIAIDPNDSLVPETKRRVRMINRH